MSVDKDMEQEIREALAKATDIYQVYDRDEVNEDTFHQTNLIGSNGKEWGYDVQVPTVDDAHLLGYSRKYLEWCLTKIATVDLWKRIAADQQALKEKAEKERDKWHGYFDQLNRDSQEANGHYAKVARTIWSGNDCPSIDQIADRYQELQRERDEAQRHAVELAKQILETEKERDALQEERDHLLAANDEFQEKLRFEEEEEDQPICFKMDANGNLTRV